MRFTAVIDRWHLSFFSVKSFSLFLQMSIRSPIRIVFWSRQSKKWSEKERIYCSWGFCNLSSKWSEKTAREQIIGFSIEFSFTHGNLTSVFNCFFDCLIGFSVIQLRSPILVIFLVFSVNNRNCYSKLFLLFFRFSLGFARFKRFSLYTSHSFHVWLLMYLTDSVEWMCGVVFVTSRKKNRVKALSQEIWYQQSPRIRTYCFNLGELVRIDAIWYCWAFCPPV